MIGDGADWKRGLSFVRRYLLITNEFQAIILCYLLVYLRGTGKGTQAGQTKGLDDLAHQRRTTEVITRSDFFEDWERDLFNSRWSSSSEGATLEEEEGTMAEEDVCLSF